MVVLSLAAGCTSRIGQSLELADKGEFSKATQVIENELQNKDGLSATEIRALQNNLKQMQAVEREYTLSHDSVYNQLKARISDLSETDMSNWENDHSLEYYMINGVKRYYSRCVFDLFQVNTEAARRAHIPEKQNDAAAQYPRETISSYDSGSVLSKKIYVGFSFFVETGNLPDRAALRAWIPYVRENDLQRNIKIIQSSIANTVLPTSADLVSMIYFKDAVDKTGGVNSNWREYFAHPAQSWIRPLKNPASISDSMFVCQFIYEYESKAYFRTIDPNTIQTYNIHNPVYEKYTGESIGYSYTPYLAALSKEIIGNETNNYLKAKKIYEWICRNIAWTNPKPILGDANEYTARYKRGDCSAQSDLFITLCRINRIPTKPQGGWSVRPDENHSQHSWAQVYFEPYGWLPVDVSAGAHLIDNQDDRIKYFYFGNCSPYHLIIYDDDPEVLSGKTFEPIYGGGAQLGAFEWKGGDLDASVKIDSHVDTVQ
jgi:hypothetical protein